MTEAKRFAVGQRVRMSQDNPFLLLKYGRKTSKTGTVVGYVRRPSYADPTVIMKIVKDGTKTVTTWAEDFWEPI